MRVKWNRNLDGSQAQQKSEEQETDSAPSEKGAVPERPPAGGFLKIFRLKRHKKTKHGELPDGKQHAADDSSESCRPVDDNVNRSELAVLPSDDDAARSVCGDSGQYSSGSGLLLRSVSVSQSRRGSEDYSDLKYRSLPSVGKGWFSFASRKSWLNLSSRGHRGSKDEKKISASSQSIPAKSLRKSETLTEEEFRESPERPVKCHSENPFPSDGNRNDVLNTPLSKQRKGSFRSKDGVCNPVYDIKSRSAPGADTSDLESSSDKTEISKKLQESVCLTVSSSNGGQKSSKNEVVSKLPVPQYVGKSDNSVLKKHAEISAGKKNCSEENRHLGIVPKDVQSAVSLSDEKNSETLRKTLPQYVETERCQKSSSDSRPEACDLPPSIAGNHHPSQHCEQSVTNDTLFHSVTLSPEEDAVFSISQDRTSLCQTEHEPVTVERHGGCNNSLPRGDNGEKNQQRNGIQSRLSTRGVESSTGQMKSLGSGISTGGGDRLASSWPAEVTHRTVAGPDASKEGRDVLEHQILNSAMFCCSAQLAKNPTENNCTKWYVPICDIREKVDNDCAVVIPPKFLRQVHSSPAEVLCESSENKTNPKHVFEDQVSENTNLFINTTSDRKSAGSSCEEKVISPDLIASKPSSQEKEPLRISENPEFSKSRDSGMHKYNTVCSDRMTSDTSLDNICLEIRNMNQRNISFSNYGNGLQDEKNFVQDFSVKDDHTNNQFLRIINGSSSASKSEMENTAHLNSPTFSELLKSADGVAKGLEKLCVAYNSNGVRDVSATEMSDGCHSSEKMSGEITNRSKSDSFDVSSSGLPSCVSWESTPKGVAGEKNDSNPLGEADLTETEEVIKQVENMISANFESCCHDNLEKKLNFGNGPDLKSKLKKFTLCTDILDDILQKSVSSDSGISEEIQELCSEELKCQNRNKEQKMACDGGESAGKSLHPFSSRHEEETQKDKAVPCPGRDVAPKQLQVHKGQESSVEKNSEKHTIQNNCYSKQQAGLGNDEKDTVQNNCYSKQQAVLGLSYKSHANIVMVNNHVQGDAQICIAQVDNRLPEIDNASPETDDVQNESLGTKSTNEPIPEELNGVIEQTNYRDHSRRSSAELEKFPINFPGEDVRLSRTPCTELCSTETEPLFSENLFTECFQTSAEKFDKKILCHFGGFSWENFHQTIRICSLIHRDTHGYFLRGDGTSHVIDIFSSDYSPTYIFCAECHCSDVLYSSCSLPYSVPYLFPPKSVKYRPCIWKSTDFIPHLFFDHVSSKGNRMVECIPVSPSIKYTFRAPDAVALCDSPNAPQKNSAVANLISRISHATSETVVGVHTADNNTRGKSSWNCESGSFTPGCAVTSGQTDCKLDASSGPATPDIQQHLPKLVKKSPQDKTDTPSKDRMVLRKSRIPRSKHGSVRVLHHPSPKPVRPPMWLSRAELSQEIQHLGTLCEARTKELNLLKMKLKHATLGFDAFAAVFKYLTEDLDALSHPQLVKELAKTQKLLHQAKNDIICYEKQIEELKTHHAKELAELSEKMLQVYQSELQQVTNQQNEELSLLEEQHQKKMVSLQNSYVEAAEKAKAEHEKEVEEIRQKFLKQKEEAELLHQSEMKHLEESHLEVQKSLQAEIEQLKVQYAESKQQSRNIEETLQKDTDTKLQWISSKKAELDKEVDSLKAVLEMKNNELHSLRKENLEMQKELEELPVAKEKIKMLQARAEDLQALMAEKVRVERQLSTEYQSMKDIFERESKTNKRLSMENEELQWRLKQASELSLLLRSQTNSPDVLDTPSPPKSPWQQQSPQQPSRSKFYTYVDPSECEPESPQAKSPAPLTASRSKFFTFVDPSEYDAQSPHSPRYKRLTPSSTSSPCKQPPLKNPVKLASTPRKSKVNTEAQSGGGTPRKMSKKQGGKISPIYPLPKTSDEEAGDTSSNIPESMESSISSEDSSLPPRDLEDPMAHICTSTKELPDDKTAAYDKSPKPESDVSILGEATDPKKYYHMTFPVLKETGTDCDADDGNSYLLLENSESCFVAAKETGDPSVTKNGYANPNDSRFDDMHNGVKVSDLTSEEVVSHKVDSDVSEVVKKVTSSPCENSSTMDGSNSQEITIHSHSAFVNEDSKAAGEVADT